VHFGFHIASSGPTATAESIRTLAQRVDALGYDSIWVSDHVVVPMEFRSRYPYPGQFTPQSAGNYFEPIVTIALLAGATQRVQVGISVLVVPQRNPVLTGKQLGTLAALAGGRLIIGIGVGWLEEEFQVLGAGDVFAHRGPATDDYVALYRALWQKDPVRFDGDHYQLPLVRALPQPARLPPIWVGGNTRPAIRRAARIGDGWHAIRIGFDEVVQGAAYLREQLRAHRRPPDAAQVSLRVHLHLDRPVEREWELGPTVGDALTQIDRFRRAGVQALIFSPPPGSDARTAVEIAERFMAEVRPRVQV